jgi:hypothetical protein
MGICNGTKQLAVMKVVIKNSNNQATLVFPQVKNLTLIGQKIPMFRLLTLATEPTFLVG